MLSRAGITLRQRLGSPVSIAGDITTSERIQRLFFTKALSHDKKLIEKAVKCTYSSWRNGAKVLYCQKTPMLSTQTAPSMANYQRLYSSSESASKSRISSTDESQEERVTSEDIEIEQDEVDYTLKLTDEDLQEITKGDPELIKKVRFIQLEHDIARQDGVQVPSKIKLRQWKELLHLGSRGARRKFFKYLWLNEMKTESQKVKKAKKREERLQSLPPLVSKEDDPDGVTYGLARNTMFLRLYDSTMHKFYHHKLANAMMFSRPLVLDCGYDEFMTPREAKNTAKQIEFLITQNRTHSQPFDLHLCNADPNSKLLDYLTRIIPTLYEDSFPINITDKSYLDIFPQKELVYLTPHCRDVLDNYREDEIYIVGAMVDKTDPRPFSLAKAKKENLRMKQLPLDKHLMWGLGTKSLTINQMANIMLDLRLTKDWKTALEHVPKRKLNRDFHPYPDQIQKPFPPIQRQSKSQVMQDFELLNQRKGYRSNFDSGSYRERSSSFGNRQQENFNGKKYNKTRSIKYDNE